MLFGKYTFQCQFESPAMLPRFKGSTFRGVFGHALKKVVCVLKRQTCETCILRNRCLYAFVFESAAAPQEGVRTTSPPHPFVIEPPLSEQTFFPAGSVLSFDLLLFGKVNHDLPYFIYAIDSMGQIGIGKTVDGQKGKFTLTSVFSNGNLIYSHTDKILRTPHTQEDELAYPVQPVNILTEPERVTMVFETPLRIKFENRLTSELPFHVLVRAMLRRADSLFASFAQSQCPSIDYRALLQEAEQVRITDNQLKWFDWKRYSIRQEQQMLMGGLTGSVTYEGNIDRFMQLIEFCSTVHIGKQTSFGLGKFSVLKS